MQTRHETLIRENQQEGWSFLVKMPPYVKGTNHTPTIALSTTKAKYRSFVNGARETIWLRILHVDLGNEQGPTKLFCDN
jgi:hypothetical protein